MTAGLVAPLGEFVQFAGDRTQVSCKTKPGVFGVHEMEALPEVTGAIVSVGAPVPGTAVGKAQKPPVTEYWPLVTSRPVERAAGVAFAQQIGGIIVTAREAGGDLQEVRHAATPIVAVGDVRRGIRTIHHRQLTRRLIGVPSRDAAHPGPGLQAPGGGVGVGRTIGIRVLLLVEPAARRVVNPLGGGGAGRAHTGGFFEVLPGGSDRHAPGVIIMVFHRKKHDTID